MPASKKVNLNDLKKEILVKWKIQSMSRFKPTAVCVAYIDARDVMNILDDVVGVENWQDEYLEIHNNLYCKLSIKINGEWISKMGCGTESMTEKEKGEESDALKRAGVKFGIGRFCYGMKIQSVATNEKKTNDNYPYPVDGSGNKIWDLTAHIENVVLRKSGKPGEPENGKKESLMDTLRKLVDNKELFDQVEESHRKSIEKIFASGKPNDPKIQPWIDFLTKVYQGLATKDNKISQEQIGHLMGIAERSGYSEDYIKRVIKVKGYESRKDILVKDYQKILDELKVPQRDFDD